MKQIGKPAKKGSFKDSVTGRADAKGNTMVYEMDLKGWVK